MVDDDQQSKPPTEKSAVPPLYRDKRTARFAAGERVKEFQAFESQAKKRLVILLEAVSRNGLMLLPGNHFEALGRGSSAFTVAGVLRVAGQSRQAVQYRDHRLSPAEAIS